MLLRRRDLRRLDVPRREQADGNAVDVNCVDGTFGVGNAVDGNCVDGSFADCRYDLK